jgi:hypothetical protein
VHSIVSEGATAEMYISVALRIKVTELLPATVRLLSLHRISLLAVFPTAFPVDDSFLAAHAIRCAIQGTL